MTEIMIGRTDRNDLDLVSELTKGPVRERNKGLFYLQMSTYFFILHEII